MTSLERISLHAAALLSGLTGLLYGWLRYFGQRLGEFGPEPHPLQSLLQHLHVLAGPLTVFALGMVIRGHFLPMLRGGRRPGRRSGWAVALVLVPMVMAGYGVQVVTGPAIRVLLAWVHGLFSLAFLLGYGVHVVRAWAVARGLLGAVEDLPISPS